MLQVPQRTHTMRTLAKYVVQSRLLPIRLVDGAECKFDQPSSHTLG